MPRSPSGASARPSPRVSIKSLELNALHTSQIQDMVHLNGNRSSGHRPSGRGEVIPCWGLEYVPWRCAMPSRIIALTIALALSASTAAIAQSNSTDQSTNANTSGSVMQPQGTTRTINTKSIGGAPASSPQGETPPGMQAAPKGSDKTVRTDTSGIPEGTPTK